MFVDQNQTSKFQTHGKGQTLNLFGKNPEKMNFKNSCMYTQELNYDLHYTF